MNCMGCSNMVMDALTGAWKCALDNKPLAKVEKSDNTGKAAVSYEPVKECAKAT